MNHQDTKTPSGLKGRSSGIGWSFTNRKNAKSPFESLLARPFDGLVALAVQAFRQESRQFLIPSAAKPQPKFSYAGFRRAGSPESIVGSSVSGDSGLWTVDFAGTFPILRARKIFAKKQETHS
ncbi:MAG: hypothetical protein HY716_07900 [Planctomycetes bacterium]|nr:hypothetical protein [Planctomycetota bacterium]